MNKKLIGLALLLTLTVTLGACDKGGESSPGGASPSGSPSPTAS